MRSDRKKRMNDAYNFCQFRLLQAKKDEAFDKIKGRFNLAVEEAFQLAGVDELGMTVSSSAKKACYLHCEEFAQHLALAARTAALITNTREHVTVADMMDGYRVLTSRSFVHGLRPRKRKTASGGGEQTNMPGLVFRIEGSNGEICMN